MTIFLGQPFLLGDDQSSQWRPFLLHQQEESWALPTRLRCSGNGTGPDFKNAEEGKSLTWFLQGSQKTASKVWSVSILYFLSNFVLCSKRRVNLWQNISWLFNKNQKKKFDIVFEAKEPKGRREYFCNKLNISGLVLPRIPIPGETKVLRDIELVFQEPAPLPYVEDSWQLVHLSVVWLVK